MFTILTDTSANLPPEYLRQEQIPVIPFTFHTSSGEQMCLDLHSFDAKAFYAAMQKGEKVTTSQIPPQRFVDVMTPLLEHGEDILFVSMSSGISGSYASAHIAAAQLRECFPERKILLVDTYSASLGEGLLVMQAVELRRAGLSIEETYQHLRTLRHRMAQIFTVGDLRYLRRTGRLSNLEAAVGTVLQIKPLLKGDPQGKIVCFPRCAAASAQLSPSLPAMPSWSSIRRRRSSASRTPAVSPTRRSWPTCCAAAVPRRRS